MISIPIFSRVLITRKIDDLRNKLKKFAREEKEVTALIGECEASENHVQNQLNLKQKIFRELQQKSIDLGLQMEKFLYRKEIKMIQILTLQTRAKWYKAIKNKKYKMSVENDDAALNETAQIREQNHELKRLLGGLLEEFPFYKRNIQKAIITLVD